MSELGLFILGDCYSVILCIIIVTVSLVTNRKTSKKLNFSFGFLMSLVLLESICGAFDRYLSEMTSVYPGRVFFAWVCFVTGPAIILTIIQITLRKQKKIVRVLLCIPEAINIVISSLAFFTKLVFYFDANNNLCAGSLIFVPNFSVVIYLVMMVVVGLKNIRARKRECVVVLMCAIFVLIDYWNVAAQIIPINMRNVTLSICILTYLLYCVAVSYYDDMEEMNSSYTHAEEQLMSMMLDQSIETLAYTIDAKDKCTKGHSFRVAKYAREIARLAGKTDEQCREVYHVGLLHDIGKIAISNSIINKKGKLTDEEYQIIQNHPAYGAKILNKMKSFPYLQDGAKYHHERYDGKGYPFGLKGEEIPEMARIIAVADAYDTMTSYRSYKSTINQIDAKQEIWKGMGTQFDPYYAKLMIALIDADVNYDLREKPDQPDEVLFDFEQEEISWTCMIPRTQEEEEQMMQETNLEYFGEFVCGVDHWIGPIEAVQIEEKEKTLSFMSKTTEEKSFIWDSPLAIVYTSKDGKVCGPEYEELGVFLSGGYSWKAGSTVREDIIPKRKEVFSDWDLWFQKNHEGMKFYFKAFRKKNMVYMTLDNELMEVEAKIQLPETFNRKIYFSLSGERIEITDIELIES